MYHADLGRFLQTDPIGYAGGINLYVYAYNDPVNLTDPNGEMPFPQSFGTSLGCHSAGRSDCAAQIQQTNLSESLGVIAGAAPFLSVGSASFLASRFLFQGATLGRFAGNAAIAEFSGAAPLVAGAGTVLSRSGDVISEARSLFRSSELRENAADVFLRGGDTRVLNINGRRIQLEPSMNASGMSSFGQDGFLLGREAFKSEAEFAETLLHELFRLQNSSAAGQTSRFVTSETIDAATFARENLQSVIE